MSSLLRLLAGAAAASALAPAPALALPAVGLNPDGNQLVMYDTGAPGTIVERHAITGVKPGETLMGLDVRPATGQLYALGIVRTAFDEGRVYVVDPGTGAATAAGASPFKSGMPPSEWGFDFNPSADQIRVVSKAKLNLRVDPGNGTLIQQDTDLDAPGIDAIAYDQNVAGVPQTTLWGYLPDVDRVIRIGGVNGAAPENSPDSGHVVQSFGASGIATGGHRSEMEAAPSGTVFMTAQTAGPAYSLYRVSLQNGTLTAVGAFPEPVEDIAVLQPSSIGLNPAVAGEGAGAATVTVTRSGNASGTQTVAYATADGSATGADYSPVSGTLTFGPGDTSKTFSVPLADDAVGEPAETVTLTLSSPTGGAALGVSSSGVTILDNDGDAQPPGPDTVKPQLLLSVPSTLKSRTLLRGLAGGFSCSEGCTTRFTLKLGGATVGTADKKLASAGTGAFKVKLSSKGKKAVRKALKRRRSARLTLGANGRDAAGNAGTATARVTVTR